MPLKLPGWSNSRSSLGGEVVGEAVVQARHGPRDRGVGELPGADGAVVVVVDPRERFVDDARVAVGHEHPLHEPGQVFGVPAPPDARGQEREQQQHERGEQAASAARIERPRRGVTVPSAYEASHPTAERRRLPPTRARVE